MRRLILGLTLLLLLLGPRLRKGWARRQTVATPAPPKPVAKPTAKKAPPKPK